jgi:uncharacterized protein
MESFTPISALLGGALIGLSASLVMLAHGRVAGVSGIFAGALGSGSGDRAFQRWFLGGLLIAGVLARVLGASTLPAHTPGLLVGGVAGLLVGYGTRLGSGCTSGHGVCGISRLSRRSLVATATFIATGMLTVAVVRALGGLS